MKFGLYYPTISNKLNQGFGSNPDYYAKFHDTFGKPLKGHNGLDFNAPHGTPVYAAHDGMIHFDRDAHGGEGMVLRDIVGGYDNFKEFPVTMYWHLIGDTDAKYPSPIPTDGKEYHVNAGQLIGYADNTGTPYESSGDHLHFGLFAENAFENLLDAGNGYDGRIDPTPYFNGKYALDIQNAPEIADVERDVAQVASVIQTAPTPQNLSIAARALVLLSKLLESIKSF